MEQHIQHKNTPISVLEALGLVITIITIISLSLFVFKVEPHSPIFASIVILIAFSLMKKHPWSYIEHGLKNGLKEGLIPIFLFILIGILIGIWMYSGTIPTLVYYGGKIMSASFFLPSVFIITAIIGTCIGSAFTTAATIGVAFMALGAGLGINPAIIAGAIISGAFFGDKMSPLSDTTNIASAVSKVDLFDHIRHMLWTTIPAALICLVVFSVIGFGGNTGDIDHLDVLPVALKEAGMVSVWAILPAIAMFLAAMKRIPAIFVMLIGILSGAVIGFVLQPGTGISELMNVMQNGYIGQTGNEAIDGILTQGGIQKMMWSVSLVLLTLSMGGLIQQLKVMERLIVAIRAKLVSTGRLILATVLTAIGVNITVGEQYMSIILTGQAFEKEFEAKGIASKNLARVLEDGGTVINPLIPYGVSGVFMAGVLGVPVLDYLPYAIFCLASPLLSVFYGFTGISITNRD
ncbi:Na+/H+ antiporter NhaC [Sutcliffiella rhizosphaerae]|uniref:Na(+)/H(+) antiporter NhaC n=1 Tax=Sutcliffiella rhizosphaerae TaxID=2880967 RepID=A0ABN8ACQ6_9BACI|nr:Na+/H+ antiporter NhaC [Sutcliffiella rhizosphaerae]CAG9622989.1 Na(+)/H(+) antiporter NhaC [Sutcliffiella rhizosphaerae]